ncbi:MAG: biopolymer transporter ExbD [Deltaproteobacteria bacterium]|nr:biopolymer transporter ExbD [Deltaproteobacteria bacterium]
MAQRRIRRRHHTHGAEDLNLTPMIDIFMIIIFFLLLTTVLVKTSIINVYLPQEQASSRPAGGPQEVLGVKVSERGFELGGVGGGAFIPKNGAVLDYHELNRRLAAIKERFPEKEDVILLFDVSVPYDTVVQVMDAARETEDKRRPLFPLVSLGENR